MLPTIGWVHGAVKLIDQRQLPAREVYLTCRTYHAVARAIRVMAIRGAPAIGVAAAYGMVLAGRVARRGPGGVRASLGRASLALAGTRPTAVNLAWALGRMRRVWSAELPPRDLERALLAEARAIEREDLAMNRALCRFGAALIKARWNVLTYCNTGGLATAGIGTALGILKESHRQGKRIHTYVCETRPALQGLRLTTWELQRARMPCTVLTDNMAGALMAGGKVDAVVVGADRIAANGDVANKIGTYTLAVLAHHHRIPFYVAAPSSTVDGRLASGKAIPIEHRASAEVFACVRRRYRPLAVHAMHPAFDVTPARYISAIVTDRGVARPPFRFSDRVR